MVIGRRYSSRALRWGAQRFTWADPVCSKEGTGRPLSFFQFKPALDRSFTGIPHSFSSLYLAAEARLADLGALRERQQRCRKQFSQWPETVGKTGPNLPLPRTL